LGASRCILGFGIWLGFLEVEGGWADMAWGACEVHLNLTSPEREELFFFVQKNEARPQQG
jgi:hypothetical protein